jgi:hypothetical protein
MLDNTSWTMTTSEWIDMPLSAAIDGCSCFDGSGGHWNVYVCMLAFAPQPLIPDQRGLVVRYFRHSLPIPMSCDPSRWLQAYVDANRIIRQLGGPEIAFEYRVIGVTRALAISQLLRAGPWPSAARQRLIELGWILPGWYH